jgi:hypothetical protein
VIVGLPEDVLGEAYALSHAAAPALPVLSVSASAIDDIVNRLRTAFRPLVWLGGSQWSEAGVAAVRRFVEAWELPVATGFRRKDLFPNRHRCYAGELGFGAMPSLVQRVRDADVLLVLGAALGDVETGGYQWLDGRPPPLGWCTCTWMGKLLARCIRRKWRSRLIRPPWPWSWRGALRRSARHPGVNGQRPLESIKRLSCGLCR